jgi:hypothetical protein
MILVTLCCATRVGLVGSTRPSLKAQGEFVQQKLKLSSNFRFDQINNFHCYEYSRTLLCCLSRN